MMKLLEKSFNRLFARGVSINANPHSTFVHWLKVDKRYKSLELSYAGFNI